MKIIFGAFDEVDVGLLSHENFLHHMHYRILQKALKMKNAQKIAKIFFQKKSKSGLRADRGGVPESL